MATVTQLLANKENAQKSTGPLSYEGKAKAGQNAIKHGIRGTCLFLDDEDPNDFQQVMDGLIASLSPAGTLELALVERIAVSLWRQQRLIRAETAGIELARRTDVYARIEAALDVGSGKPIKASDFQPP